MKENMIKLLMSGTKNSTNNLNFKPPQVFQSSNKFFKDINVSPEAKPISTIEISLTKLGFRNHIIDSKMMTLQKQAEAILNIFNMAGYLAFERLWQDINHIPSIKNKKETFLSLTNAIKASYEDPINLNKFNTKELYNKLKSITLKNEEWMDLLLYISQHAFNRHHGQERHEMTTQEWVEQSKEEYYNSARILGLIDRKMPQYLEYDIAWIAGASRLGVLSRMLEHKYILSNTDIKINNSKIFILAGQRELWAELDGINPKIKKILENSKNINIDDVDIYVPNGNIEETINEGKNYLSKLAKIYNIKLNEEQTFIKYEKDQAPLGRFPGRNYPNYDKEEKCKLTETLLCKDLAKKSFSDEVVIINTQSLNNQRPNIYTTAKDAMHQTIKEIIHKGIEKKIFKILLITNNPYIERQEIATQFVVNKVLEEVGLAQQGYQFIIDGVGFSSKQDIKIIHSELASLMAEKWKMAHFDEKEIETHIKPLLFQTRDKEIIFDPMPEELNIIGTLNEELS